MNNIEFNKHIKRIGYIDFNGFNLKIVDSLGVLLSISLKRNSNHFDTLIDHIYANYFKKVSVEKVYLLLEILAKTIILEHCKDSISQNGITDIENVYTGNTETFLVKFDDKIGNYISDSHITNLQCEEMDLGFKKAFISDELPIGLENVYLMNV